MATDIYQRTVKRRHDVAMSWQFGVALLEVVYGVGGMGCGVCGGVGRPHGP